MSLGVPARPRLTVLWCRVVETHASVPAPRPLLLIRSPPLPLGSLLFFYGSRLIRARGFQRKLSRFPLRGCTTPARKPRRLPLYRAR